MSLGVLAIVVVIIAVVLGSAGGRTTSTSTATTAGAAGGSGRPVVVTSRPASLEAGVGSDWMVPTVFGDPPPTTKVDAPNVAAAAS